MRKLRTERILLISIRHLQDYALLAHAEVRRLTRITRREKNFASIADEMFLSSS